MGYGRRGLNTLRWFSKVNEFPLILGREFCGIVRGKGSKVREDIEIGDKVWGVVSPQRPGAHAEYVLVDQSTVSQKSQTGDEANSICHSIWFLVDFDNLFIIPKYIDYPKTGWY